MIFPTLSPSIRREALIVLGVLTLPLLFASVYVLFRALNPTRCFEGELCRVSHLIWIGGFVLVIIHIFCISAIAKLRPSSGYICLMLGLLWWIGTLWGYKEWHTDFSVPSILVCMIYTVVVAAYGTVLGIRILRPRRGINSESFTTTLNK